MNISSNKKTAYIYHFFQKCLMLLLFVFSSGFSSGSTFKMKKGKVVIVANSQSELDLKVVKNQSASEIYLKLNCNHDFDLNVLKKLKLIRILSIEFPVSGENADIIGDCGVFREPLDISFVENLNMLEFLMIDWRGETLNENKISSLSSLKFARLPLSAFNPAIFQNNINLRQLEFGDERKFIFTRKSNRGKNHFLILSSHSYEFQMHKRNKTFKRFNKVREKRVKEFDKWPSKLLRENGNSDTLVYYSTIDEYNVNWILADSNQTIRLIGNSADGSRIVQKFTTDYIMSEFKTFDENSFRIKRKDKVSGSYMEYGYRNGQLDGLQLSLSGDYINSKRIYNEGFLEYEFPYLGGLPKIPDFDCLVNFSSMRKEALFNPEGLYIIRANGQYLDENAFGKTEFPIQDMKLNGVLILIDGAQDTILSVSYLKGVLNGPYYYYSKSYKDSAKVFCYYKDGFVQGEKKIIRNYTTTISKVDRERWIKVVTTRNSDGQLLEEKIWVPEKRHYQLTVWLPDGNLALKRILDEKDVIIWEKYFHKPKGYSEDEIAP